MELRNLAAVVKIADTRSFRLAAEALNTTQPTLSRLIAQLESELGVTLFRRGWSGAETTPEGEIVYTYATRVFDTLAEVEATMHASRLRHLTLAQMEVITEVRARGGASAAAAAFGRSQPAISRVLTDAQHVAGVPLFRRSRDGLVPLPEADKLVDLYSRITNIHEKLVAHLARNSERMTGRVALGLLPFSSQSLVTKVFSHLGNLYPGARLVLVPGTYTGLVDALRRGEIEGFLGVMRGDNCPADLREEPLLTERFAIVARADHPVHDTPCTIADLRRQSWIVPPFGSPVRAYFERVFGDFDNPPHVQTSEIQFFSAAEQILAESNAIGMQTYTQRTLDRLPPELRAVAVALPDAETQIGLTTSKDAQDDPLFAEFKRLVTLYTPEFA